MASIIIIVALILSIVLHEVAHGYMANFLGDPTARLAGRLTANPLKHIDPLGSIIIPALLFLTHSGILFGWAKPVPYNPYNLNNQKWGEALVAAAGPATNLLLAIIFAVIIRLAVPLGLSVSFVQLSGYIVYINILLALFNLIPIPPLDGSRILAAILPLRPAMKYRELTRWVEGQGLLITFVFIFIFVNILWVPFSALLGTVFSLLTGMSGL